MTMLKN